MRLILGAIHVAARSGDSHGNEVFVEVRGLLAFKFINVLRLFIVGLRLLIFVTENGKYDPSDRRGVVNPPYWERVVSRMRIDQSKASWIVEAQ